jgi:hypothetical protein
VSNESKNNEAMLLRWAGLQSGNAAVPRYVAELANNSLLQKKEIERLTLQTSSMSHDHRMEVETLRLERDQLKTQLKLAQSTLEAREKVGE